MMIYNCLINITSLQGNENKKEYKTLASNVKALILPVSTDILSLFPDVPVGSGYQFMINTDAVTVIPPGAKLTVSDAYRGELTANDVYLVKDTAQKTKVMGIVQFSGVCVKTN